MGRKQSQLQLLVRLIWTVLSDWTGVWQKETWVKVFNRIKKILEIRSTQIPKLWLVQMWNIIEQINPANITLSLLQVVVSHLPTGISVAGAVFLGFDNETGTNMWSWSVTNTTAVRSDPTYSQVCNCDAYHGHYSSWQKTRRFLKGRFYLPE